MAQNWAQKVNKSSLKTQLSGIIDEEVRHRIGDVSKIPQPKAGIFCCRNREKTGKCVALASFFAGVACIRYPAEGKRAMPN